MSAYLVTMAGQHEGTVVASGEKALALFPQPIHECAVTDTNIISIFSDTRPITYLGKIEPIRTLADDE